MVKFFIKLVCLQRNSINNKVIEVNVLFYQNCLNKFVSRHFQVFICIAGKISALEPCPITSPLPTSFGGRGWSVGGHG